MGTNTDFLSTAKLSSNDTTLDLADEDNQEIYVLLRPGAQLFAKFFGAFEAATAALNSADIVRVAGFARDEHQFRVTVVVNLGPKKKVSEPSDTAVRGFALLQSLYVELSDYLPQYTFAPSDDEREQALELLRALELRTAEIKAS